jgi:hypothetical protein
MGHWSALGATIIGRVAPFTRIRPRELSVSRGLSLTPAVETLKIRAAEEAAGFAIAGHVPRND